MKPVKVIIFAAIAVLAVLATLVGAHFLMAIALLSLLHMTGIDLTWLDFLVGPLLFGLIILAMKKGLFSWNRRYTCHGEALIDAPIEAVWDGLRFFERDDYFTAAMTRVRPVPGREDEFHLLFNANLVEEDGPDRAHIKILDEEPCEYLAFHVLNTEEMPLFGKDHLMTEILLEQQDDGVRVRYYETLSRLTLVGFLAFLFLNPARDSLKSLKAQVEGTANASVLANMIGPDGEPTAEVNRAVWIGTATAMLITTAICAGLVYFVMRLTTG